INKEVCESSNAHECRPGGPGPWVKKAGLGPLSLLGATLHWRITVTNAGPVGIAGATLNDAVEHSCVTTAGTFSLAAGASTQSLSDARGVPSLLQRPNTVAATSRPTTPPPGPPPTTTGSSSARACPGLICL